LLQASLLAWGGAQHSPTWDEPGHLLAGISHWRFGTFDLYRVNPPLVRLVACAPAMFGDVRTDWSRYDASPGERSERNIRRDFFAANGLRAFRLFVWGRWACIPFSLLGAVVCFLWARALYGDTAGIAALALWCFEPSLIAHGQLITPDAAAAAVGAAAGYVFWLWLRRPEWTGALAAGTALGFAELTKATWIILFALWPALWLAYRWPDRRRGLPWRSGASQAAQIGLILTLGVFLLNAGYGFEGSFQCLGDYRFVSPTLAGPREDVSALQLGNRFADSWLGCVPVPLPRNYVLGIDLQHWDFQRGMWSYLEGQWRTTGWWYYYLHALAIKVPLGIWILLALAFLAGLLAPGYSAARRDELVLLAPALAVLVLVSSQTGMTINMRYVLPCFPFALIWMSRIARSLPLRRQRLAVPAAGALAWAITSSLWVYPHSLSYFNELAGGPMGGPAHLLDSNVDWGQDLLYLKKWLHAHPEAQPLGLAFYCCYDARHAGIDYAPVPPSPGLRGHPNDPRTPGPLPGWYAMSVNEIRSQDQQYEYFLRFRPVATAGYSIYIYDIGLDEANRVRRELGLPELPG
jgi:4-amino-4-deoxy-L-arabinose transferase-like glycosyltransferase